MVVAMVVAMVVVVTVVADHVHTPAMEAMQRIQRQQDVATVATEAIIKIDTIQTTEVPTVVILMNDRTTGRKHAEVDHQDHQLLFRSSSRSVCLEAVAEIATTATMAATSL